MGLSPPQDSPPPRQKVSNEPATQAKPSISCNSISCSSAARSPFEDRLVALIGREGPITVGEFMTQALGDPEYGYYMTHTPFGQAGDFVTAPDISQIFGEVIGAWLIEAWRDIGAPASVTLIELGPGRGTLAADILRTAQLVPAFQRALNVCLVETSPHLREMQRRTLAPYDTPLRWAASLRDIPCTPSLVIANEFFDCLPIRQFICTRRAGDTVWHERLIGTEQTPNGPRLNFTSAATASDRPPPGAHGGWPRDARENDIFEVNMGVQPVIGQIAHRFNEAQGRALVIDYGHLKSAVGETLQAVRRHQFCDPLAHPGDSDITAHVDFDAVRRMAQKAGLETYGPELQGDFLHRLGAQARLHALSRTARADQAAALHTGVRRLTHPDEMGALFKVLCLATRQECGMKGPAPARRAHPPAGFTP